MAAQQDIYAQAEILLGRALSGAEREKLLSLCAAAAGELEARLREGVSSDELGETFTRAAGVLALSLYVQLGEVSSDASSVKLGSVSVSRRGAGSVRTSANALRRQAEAMLAQFLQDGGFAFRGVRG